MEGRFNILRAIGAGMLVMLAGTLPRNFLFSANLTVFNQFPWAVPVAVVGLRFFWKYPGRPYGRSVPGRVWLWSMVSGGLGIVTLVLALRMLNTVVALPQQSLPDLRQVPTFTVAALLLMAAPIAGVVEEVAFRGYMQEPIARQYGLAVAIFVTGTMFAVAHLDFTWILWPYYMAVAALYGVVAHMTRSVLPGVVLHTCGNLYSNFDLWMSGHAEWQAGAGGDSLVMMVWMSVCLAGMLFAFFMLRKAATRSSCN